MRVLIFQAAVSAVAIAAMTRFAEELRAEGHQAGVRSLPHFRREKEPADAIVVALTPQEAGRYKSLGAELVQVFNDTDRIIPFELPEDAAEHEDLEFDDILNQLDGDTTGFMTLEKLRAEAIERGLEVTAQTTREQLEHMLDVDVHPGPQAADRETGKANDAGVAEQRIGLRTSTVLPSANGLDLERMNDEQLHSTAAQLGIDVPRTARRSTVINKITKTFAERTAAPAGSGVKSPAETVEATDLEGKSEDELRTIAENEGIDVGRATSVEGLTQKITEGRQAKAEKEGSNG